MFDNKSSTRIGIGFLLVLVCCLTAMAQTTSFTYQGKLSEGGNPANAQYDFIFRLFDSGGHQINNDLAKDDVQVTAGVFTVLLDFEKSPFADGSPYSLEIAVRPGADSGSYTTLTPRQPITSAPYSLRATNAVVSENVSGVVGITNGGTGSTAKSFVDLSTDQANIAGNKTFTGAVGVTGATGVFNGNGSGLTGLNGANITAGSVTTTQLSIDAVSNSSTLTLLASLRWDVLKGQRNIAVGSAPAGMVFDGTNMWVVNVNGNSISKIRVSDGVTLNTFAAGSGPQYAAFDGTNIWVTDFTSASNVRKIRASDGAIVGTFTVPTFASAIVYDGTNLWIQNGNAVSKLRASDGVVVGTYAVGSFPLRIVFDGANVWVANFSSSNVTKLRGEDGFNLGTFTVSGPATGITFDGNSIWVATTAGLTKLRQSDGANLGSFAIAAGASDIGFDGSNLWVISNSTPQVFRVRTSDGTVFGTYTVGTTPKALAFDGRNMWVTNQGSSSATILPPAFPE